MALETRHLMTSSTRNGTTEARAHDGVIEMRCIVAILKHVTADVIEMQRNYPVKSFTCRSKYNASTINSLLVFSFFFLYFDLKSN